MTPFPTEPDVPVNQRARGTLALRYEDVSQDGRLRVEALPAGLGPLWQALFARRSEGQALRDPGVIPILSRLVIEGGEGPIGVAAPLSVEGCFELAHTADDAGAVNRVLMNMWLRASAPRGRTHGPPPDGAGEPLAVGRVYAEHVFTRPFAPPEERKVLRLDAPGIPPVPPTRRPLHAAEGLLALPEGAVAHDATEVVDETTLVFGLAHTDSNQHVNSLVYPRLFEEAALRRFDARGMPTAVLCRRVEMRYRKPCFAGDRVRVTLRAFTAGQRTGAVGAFVSADTPSARPYCYVAALFEPTP